MSSFIATAEGREASWARAPNSLLPREDRRSEQRGQMEKKPLVILQTDLCSVTQLRGTRSEEADCGNAPDIPLR